jgi:hypothetical protein
MKAKNSRSSTRRKPKSANSRRYRVVLAVVVIATIIGTGYEYYQQQLQPSLQPQQSLQQQEAMSILKKYGGYDGNYSYTVFAALDAVDILGAANHTTLTFSYVWTAAQAPMNAATISGSSTYTAYGVSTTGLFSYAPTYSAYTTMQTYSTSFTYTNASGRYGTASYVTETQRINDNITIEYSIQGEEIYFRYDRGPICSSQSPNGPYGWSGCSQFVIMVIYSPSTLALYPEYLVMNRYNLFYNSNIGPDWQFYFFYAIKTGLS